MKISVIDVETTGPDPERDQVIEIAVVGLEEDLTEVSAWSSFVKPNIAISPQASAVHHIIESDLGSALDLTDVVEAGGLTNDVDIAVAHNSSFEKTLLPMVKAPWLCTYKCALTAWPDAPSHALHALRYWIGFANIDGVDREAGEAHRALPDAYVCAELLRALTIHFPITEMLNITVNPVLLSKFQFGKHEGQPVEDIPSGYLKWMLSQDFDENVLFTAQTIIDRKERWKK